MSTYVNYESDDVYRLRKLLEHNQMLLEVHEMRRREAEEVKSENCTESARGQREIKCRLAAPPASRRFTSQIPSMSIEDQPVTLKIIPSVSTETASSRHSQRIREIKNQFHHQSKSEILDHLAQHIYATEQAWESVAIQRRISTLR